MDQTERSLWTKLRSGKDPAARDSLASMHLELVRLCAGRLAMHLPGWIREEDLYGAGCSGLLGAIDRYEPARGVPFEGFALPRVRGAMLDELRALDILPRAARDRADRVRSAEEELAQRRPAASDEEIARRAGVTLGEYLDVERALRTSRMLSLEAHAGDDGRDARAILPDSSAERPGAALERSETVEWVRKQLSGREREIVVLYYDRGLTLREVGKVLGVTEGRVSQILTALMARLRRELER